jgi:hypothetical protein
MKKNNLLKLITLVGLSGIPMVVASVPRSGSVSNDISNDTAIYQNLHEIKIKKVKSLDFDSDIDHLSAQEKSHREALPMRISAPMDRVMSTPYKPGYHRSEKPASKSRFRNR